MDVKLDRVAFGHRELVRHLGVAGAESTQRRLWIVGVAAVLQIVSGQAWMAFHGERLASMG